MTKVRKSTKSTISTTTALAKHPASFYLKTRHSRLAAYLLGFVREQCVNSAIKRHAMEGTTPFSVCLDGSS